MEHRNLLLQSFSLRGIVRMWYRSKLYNTPYYKMVVVHERDRKAHALVQEQATRGQVVETRTPTVE